MAKKIIGIVTSDIQSKTIVVTETSRQTHPLYGKQYTRSRKYAAHDEKNQAHIGDKVQIVECRPISRHKSFTLERVIESGHEKIDIIDPVTADEPVVKTEPQPAKKPVTKKTAAKPKAEAVA